MARQGAYNSDFGTTPDVKSTITDLSKAEDTKLVSLLQTDASKEVDENGEPRVVYHGTLSKSLIEFNCLIIHLKTSPMFTLRTNWDLDTYMPIRRHTTSWRRCIKRMEDTYKRRMGV